MSYYFEIKYFEQLFQVFSARVAYGLKVFRTNPETAAIFTGTESTEELVTLLNNAFDVIYGRRLVKSINLKKWKGKKAVRDVDSIYCII